MELGLEQVLCLILTSWSQLKGKLLSKVEKKPTRLRDKPTTWCWLVSVLDAHGHHILIPGLHLWDWLGVGGSWSPFSVLETHPTPKGPKHTHIHACILIKGYDYTSIGGSFVFICTVSVHLDMCLCILFQSQINQL